MAVGRSSERHHGHGCCETKSHKSSKCDASVMEEGSCRLIYPPITNIETQSRTQRYVSVTVLRTHTTFKS